VEKGTTPNGTLYLTPANAEAGANVNITVEPDAGYRLKEGSLKVNGVLVTTGSGNQWTFVMPATDVTVTAEFEPVPEGEHSVIFGTFANGSVSGPANAAEGATVTLTVSAAEGYRLKADSLQVNGGAVTVTGSGNQRTFTMPASNVTVTAEFEQLPEGEHSVTIDSSLTGGSIGTNKDSAAVNETVTLTVTPATGYEYSADNLKVNDGAVTLSGSGNTYTFTMPDAHVTVTAAFTLKAYQITTSGIDNGNVTATVNGATVTTATMGASVTLTAVPAENYQLQSIAVTDEGDATVTLGGSDTIRTFTMPASDVTVAATFVDQSAPTYTVSIPNPFEHGTVSADLTSAVAETPITLTASPAGGYRLAGITVTKTSDSGTVTVSGTENTRTFTMPASNVTVAAVFETVGTYTITINDFEHGSITASAQVQNKGTTVVLTQHPEAGYKAVLNSLTVTRTGTAQTVAVGTFGEEWSFNMPEFDVTVSQVQFKAIDYNITITAPGNGNSIAATVNGSAATTATVEDTVTIEATPDGSYEFKSVTVTKKGSGTVEVNGSGNTRTFAMPADDVTVAAVFGSVGTYAISVPGSVTAKVNSAAVDSAAAGTEITLTVSPASGYRLKADSLKVNNGAVEVKGSGNTWTFTMPPENVSVQAEFEVSVYNITIASDIANGTVKASKTGQEGNNITLTPAPNLGCVYTEGTIAVTKTGSTETVEVKNSNGNLIFTMPAFDVTVTAQFTKETDIEAGLYVTGNNTPLDLSERTEPTMLAKALGWIKAKGSTSNGKYTIVLDTKETESGSGYVIGTYNSSTGTNSHTGSKMGLTITLTGLTGGITITKEGTGPLFILSGNGSTDKVSLILENITLAGNNANNTALVSVGGDTATRRGVLTMNNGSQIVGNKGGGVNIVTSAANSGFTMNGGTIKGNSAASGAAVLGISGAVFTKTGGTIYGSSGDGDANKSDDGHAIVIGSNYRNSTADEDTNTADEDFWAN
jgi:hypothetical protein